MYISIDEFVKDWNREAFLTQKVLDVLTDESLQQRVSPEGRTLGRIIWHFVSNIPEYLTYFGFKIEVIKDPEGILYAEKIAKIFQKVSSNVVETVKEQWSDETLKQTQDAFGRETTNGTILNLLIRHIIHHRGQATVLIDQAGLKVPGVYGPSREEWIEMGKNTPL
ncbi:DinB family protein [Bacillus gobiensis]|uniref:DinB family protein n=1 Tax=Bacillus gobiensis TaxID=1441095 RepID=UPI003D22A833